MTSVSGTEKLTKPDWKGELNALLPLLGHRNWIVVADAAYPAQSSLGIETIVSGAGQIEVARGVLDAITVCKHVRATVYLDQELQFVAEGYAPGVSHYRARLAQIFQSTNPMLLPHDQIIAKLDQVSQNFRVLVIKTELTIPYTTIFFELECRYWNDEAEQQVRQAMTAVATN